MVKRTGWKLMKIKIIIEVWMLMIVDVWIFRFIRIIVGVLFNGPTSLSAFDVHIIDWRPWIRLVQVAGFGKISCVQGHSSKRLRTRRSRLFFEKKVLMYQLRYRSFDFVPVRRDCYDIYSACIYLVWATILLRSFGGNPSQPQQFDELLTGRTCGGRAGSWTFIGNLSGLDDYCLVCNYQAL